ncbi:MAG: hypothetical protein ACRD3J_03570 [Thermoanaerobaculia bacterium]
MKVKPTYDGYSVRLPNAQGEMENIGSLSLYENVAHLVELKSFIYAQEADRISVRLELKKRGSEFGYWVAYKRRKGRLHKTYVCEAYMLNPWNLDDAARRLL